MPDLDPPLPPPDRDPPAVPPPARPRAPWEPGVLLLVPDGVLADLLGRAVRRAGLQVVTAADVQAVSAYAAAPGPLAVVVDADGVSLRAAVAAVEAGVGPRPLVLLASSPGPSAGEVGRCVIAERLRKPFGVEQLLAAVRRALALDEAAERGPEDERTLAAALRAGDAAALRHLYRRYFGRLYRYALHKLGDHAAAEDVASEALERLLGALGRLDGRELGLKPYLFRIAANLVADHHRRLRRLAPLEEVPAGRALSADPAELAERLAAWGEMEALLGRLTEAQRAVLVLRFAHGMSGDEVAARLGTTRGAVKALQHRALAALRRLLEARGGRQGDTPPPAR